MGRRTIALLLVGLIAGMAQASEIDDGIRSLSRTQETGWISWTVPQIEPYSTICCSTWRGGRVSKPAVCRLENDRLSMSFEHRRSNGAEGAKHLRVFARVDGGEVDRIATFSSDCVVETGEVSLTELGQVATETSVRWLSDRLTEDEIRELDETLMALSLHPGEGATRALVDAARHQPSEIRGQALFWLAQRAGEQVAGRLLDAATEDPDAEVREAAVFAISQLSRDRAVLTLIDLARTNRHVDVRREAIFWLGQTRDPRSVDFLEEILADGL